MPAPYPIEFRREAVALLKSSGKSVPQLANELGVSPQSLRNWSRQLDVDEGRSSGLTTDERRLAILRRLLEDRSIDPRDRFAGSVLLLYAQPLTRIARIRISDIATTSDGAITLTIGRGRFTLPEPLASIALALRY